MTLPTLSWLVISLLCLLDFTDGAIVHESPSGNLLEAPDWGIKSQGRVEEPPLLHKLSPPVLPTAVYTFQPTFHRCCQTGKRVAKKKMVCDITRLAVERKYIYERQRFIIQYSNKPIKKTQKSRLNKLSEKIAKCSAVHPKHFIKCCTEQEEYLKDRKKCQLKPKKLKRRCKQSIKKRYS